MMQVSKEVRSASQVVLDYLTAFYSADFDTARSLVADDFSFRGPFLQIEGGDAFFQGAAGLASIVRGYQLVRQWQDGHDVSSVYEVNLETPGAKGTVLMSEWSTVRDGQLTASRVVFDTAAFRALVPPRP
jgi:ketosteroid isomerase-like protein